jgi:hypothetical protein
VKEILVTERTYIQCLNVLIEDYQLPLEAIANDQKDKRITWGPKIWITSEQIKCIFYQIKVIHGLNKYAYPTRVVFFYLYLIFYLLYKDICCQN